MAENRVSKHWTGTIDPNIDVSNTDINSSNLLSVLLALKESDVTYTFMMTLFGEFEGKALCHPYDTFEVPVGAYVYKDINGKELKNTNKFITTIGIWIWNVYMFRDDGIAHVIGGYMNKNVNKKVYNNLNDTLSYAFLEDKITSDQMSRVLDKTQWLMPFEDILSPNQSEKMLSCTKVIEKKKKELYKKYKDGIDSGKVDDIEKMEQELIAFAKDYMGDDPAMDTFLSGGGGDFNNNFKNMYVMKGAIQDPDPNAKKQYNVALSCYADGISADEYSLIANSLSAGPYARGKKTQGGGYWEKLFVSGLQYVVLDEPGSDCGTKHYIEVTLTDKNISDYMYSYIIQGEKLIELTSDVKDKYIGKKVKLRFSSMCNRKNGKICNHCAGNLFYRLGIKNIGVACSQIASTYKNVCMKNFHDSTVKTSRMDIMKAFSLKE